MGYRVPVDTFVSINARKAGCEAVQKQNRERYNKSPIINTRILSRSRRAPFPILSHSFPAYTGQTQTNSYCTIAHRTALYHAAKRRCRTACISNAQDGRKQITRCVQKKGAILTPVSSKLDPSKSPPHTAEMRETTMCRM